MANTTSITRTAKKLKRMEKTFNDKSQQQQKNQILNQDQDQNQQQNLLIPGLPNEITELCLSRIKPCVLYSVCHSWRNFIYSPNYTPFLSLYAVLASSSPPNQHRHQEHFPSIEFFSYDPVSSKWRNLPQPPSSDPPLKLILKHPSFISRDFPVQTVAVAGKLVLLAATADDLVPALSLPLIFDPRLNKWSYGPPISSPRRWCAAGACSGNAYVASGMGSIYSNEVAKSVEKLSFNSNNETETENVNVKKKIEWEWELKRSMNDERFSREAIDAVGFKNKLYMVNVKGCYAKEGIVYDVVEDEWADMKRGMKSGWRGPVASMDEEYMFCVSEVKGVLRVYDPERDRWDDLVQDERFVGAKQMSAASGKVCVVQCGGEIVVVDVMAKPIRIWNVEPPPGFSALAVHILPRMNQTL